MKRQKIAIVFLLPEGEQLKDAPRLIEWFGDVVARARFQEIECDLFIDDKKEEVNISFLPQQDGRKPS